MKKTLKFVAAASAAGMLAFAAAPVDAAHGIAEQTIGLNAAREVGSPGEKGASGKITLEFYGPGGGYGLDDTSHICYDITVRNISAMTGLHIHEAGRKENGPVVVPLAGAAFPTTQNDDGEPCVAVGNELFNELLDSPRDYYVNYHTVNAPGGAIRGQLHGFGG